MQLGELKTIIQASGGKCFTLEYAEALLEKVGRVEAADGYGALMKQLRSAKEQGDFRGRVLEVNFANIFLEKGIGLEYGAKQGMAGDIDFCWNLSGYRIFIEMKLLGEDRDTKKSINQQLQNVGFSSTMISDDTRDIARIQRDIAQKSTTRKFNPKPENGWINLVAVDVSELQLGTVDVGDCLLAALGNDAASKYYHPSRLRDGVVGVFERKEKLSDAEKAWSDNFHAIWGANPHPRDYIHGALFLFRDPKELAALSYQLSAAVVWNTARIQDGTASKIGQHLHQIVPCTR